ncbi:MAG TPA: exodeoxyribonuclease VII large subunit [Acidobacteriaceae bacterium]|nr:exodeoxyribonuclease VII large subunit [Acidobacteriaceae bacterium]
MPDPKDSSVPGSLADLLLSGRPVRKTANQGVPSSDTGGQMNLLFSTAVESAPKPAAAVPRAAGPKPAVALGEAPDVVRDAERKIWTIRDLVAGVRRRLEREYDNVLVEGEISNCRPAASGHVYFTLKDGDAQLAVVLFRAQAVLLRFRPQDGIAVFVRGRVSVYDQRGQLQLIAETMEPRGAGALQLAFEQLKARLQAEGLFDQSRKRPLPPFPRCVGVVTSTSGAVLHDIIKVVRRRHARLELLVYPAAVQGPGCAASVSAGIRWFNANPGRVDLILIARGGGSMEDLAGFNDEALARTIAASELPVVSAVGHETDFSIVDFVADLRAPTPSAAAEIITAAQHRVEERVQDLDGRLRRAVLYRLMMARQRYSALAADQVLTRARDVIGRRGQRVDELDRRLETVLTVRLRAAADRVSELRSRVERQNPTVKLVVARRRLESAQECIERLAVSTISMRTTRLEHASARLQALSPLAVLSRGYALVYGPDGALLRNAANAKLGDTIRARFANGSLDAQVTRTNE